MTFSIVARCSRTGSLGVVTCTTGRSVGSVVPHVEEKVGAVATQHVTNPYHGFNILHHLKEGFKPEPTLASTLALDPEPELRQLLIIDSGGRTAAYTGKKNSPWCGHEVIDDAVIGGNDLKGEHVLEAMEKAFVESVKEPLHERLVRVIEAGFAAGGCRTPDHTTALKVVGVEDDYRIFWRPSIDLRIDWSRNAQPTKELRELYEDYKLWIKSKKGVT